MRMEFSDERISAYLDGELAAEERAEVEAWLGESPEHRQLLAELAALHSDLQSLPQLTLGNDFAQRVVAAAVASKSAAEATVVPHDSPAVAPASSERRRRRMNSALMSIPALAGAALVAALLIGRPWQKNGHDQPIAVVSVDSSIGGEIIPAVAQLRQAVPQPGEALVLRVRVSQATLMNHGLDAALAKSGIHLGPADQAALANSVGNAFRQKVRETHRVDELASSASDAIFIDAPQAQIENLLTELGQEAAAKLAVRPEMLVKAVPVMPHDKAEGESGSAGKLTTVPGPVAQRLNAGIFRLPKESAGPIHLDSIGSTAPDSRRPIQVLLIIEAVE